MFQTWQNLVTLFFGKHTVCKLAVALVLASLASAEIRSVCIEDRVGLNPFILGAFRTEIRELISFQELSVTVGKCPGPAVSLVIAAYPPARYAYALGLANHSGERVVPELRIYTAPVRRMIGEQASAAQLGRALARVAAHELGHYLLQQISHDESGLMRTSFRTAQLGSEDSTPFRASAIR